MTALLDETPTRPTPDFVVLDTNTLMRCLILQRYVELPLLTGVKALRAQILLAPCQEDEVWRNLKHVLDEYRGHWAQTLKSARGGVSELGRALKVLGALGATISDAEAHQANLQRVLESVVVIQPTWTELRLFAEDALGDPVFARLDNEARSEAELRVDDRLRRGNPPCGSKKGTATGDATVWETVLAALRAGHAVWFATCDGDFQDQGALHPFLVREVDLIAAATRFRFFPESRDTGMSVTRRFGVVEAILERRRPLTPAVRRTLEAARLVTPHSAGEFEEALRLLSFREREVLKLRLGVSDDLTESYRYSLEEVSQIFKVSRERIRQIEVGALQKLGHTLRRCTSKPRLVRLAAKSS